MMRLLTGVSLSFGVVRFVLLTPEKLHTGLSHDSSTGYGC